MTLSVIIPVYNAEPYLEKCVQSCLAPDCEIILIDDGSTDGSLALARRIAAEHPGISVFSQENSGPGAARNVGIRAAKGEVHVEVRDIFVVRDAHMAAQVAIERARHDIGEIQDVVVMEAEIEGDIL